MLIALTVIGWLLFVCAALLYFRDSRENSKQLNALELFCMSILLSDEYRSLNQERFDEILNKRGDLRDIEKTIYLMMAGLTEASGQMVSNNFHIARLEVERHLSEQH